MSLPVEAHPRNFYQTFFSALARSFEERFDRPFNLEHALSLAAYDAINGGQEAQPLEDVLKVLKTQLQSEAVTDVHAQDVANWLVSKAVIIPYRGGRVAFFHQSVTEYLAAGELARRYRSSPHILKEKLTLTRWDQSLLLTLSLLSPEEGTAFLRGVVDADFALALNATKYLEFGRDEVVAKLLYEIPVLIKSESLRDYGILYAVEFGMAISDVHDPQLRALMKCGNSIGAAAVTRLLELKGESIKEEILQSLVEAKDDYNYCDGIGRALSRFAAPDDVERMVALADSIQGEISPDTGHLEAEGFIAGTAAFLKEIDLEVIRQRFLPKDKSEPLSKVRAAILCDILQERNSTAALDLAGELLMRGVDQAATSIYFIGEFAEPEHRLSWSTFTTDHVGHLLSKLDDGDEENWALPALKCLCQARPDLAEVVRARASEAYGVAKAALLYCASSANVTPVFETLAELAEKGVENLAGQATHLLKHIDLNWTGHEALLVQLLRLRDIQLALALLDNVSFGWTIGELEIGPIDWWLEWLVEAQDDKALGFSFRYSMSELFARYLSAESRRAFVTEFNKSGSKFRGLLARFILPLRSDLTTDEFSEDAISFLLADLNRDGSTGGLPDHLFGSTATENLVTERLLPLLSDAKPPLSENLRNVLQQAGSRHGRRYVVA